MSKESIDRDLETAISIARLAGERCLGLREEGRWEGKMLADVGDQAADGFLQGFIQGRYPEDGILSEETVDSPERLGKRRTWIIDPLDGTKEYSAVREDWAVHVALTLDGKCALAAVALPSLGEVLYGVALPGQERGGTISGQELVPGSSPSPAQPKVAVSRSHTPPWVEKFADTLGLGMHRCGSAGFKVSQLLTGQADIYVHKVGLKEWDTCAPETVARAMGWHVCKLRGDEHVYNQANPHNHELVVCRPEWKDRVLEAIKSSGALEDKRKLK